MESQSRPSVPDRVANSSGWIDENRCRECHTQGDLFSQTGHAQTLRPAVENTGSISRLRKLQASPTEIAQSLKLYLESSNVSAVDTGTTIERPLTLEWCFGSGHHACTWVGTLSDSWGATDLVEFRWTWYSAVHDFDVTPGQPTKRGADHFGGLGVLFDHPKARRCFACHSSYLPMPGGRLDETGIKPGVTCQRCHGPQHDHVASGGSSIPESLHQLSQSESVNRCAQCHRRAEEQEPADIRRDNPEIVRFQPVGLVQSACFQMSPKMTCTTCHDPHRPLEAQDSLGIWQCVQCHSTGQPSQTTCKSGRLDDCLTCHMPKVRSSSPLFFTDHWIRIREHDEIP